MFEITRSAILWSSKKQPIVTTLSVEAEYMVSSNTMKEAIWFKTLLGELNFPQIFTTIIYTNNQGYITLTYNPINHLYVKHIDIKYYFIHEHIEQDEVKLKYVLTSNMLADIFTKQVSYESFVRFREWLDIILISH